LCFFRKVEERIPRRLRRNAGEHGVHEHPDFWGKKTPFSVNGVEIQVLGTVLGEQPHQPAGRDVLADEIRIELDDAKALERCLPNRQGTVDGRAAVDRD
jgi:hypothetical protein